MLRIKLFATLAALALTMVALPATAFADETGTRTGASTTRVEYKGTVTTLAALESEIGETHCHDGNGQGQLTCFATEREVDLDLIARGGLPPEAAKEAARKWGVALPKQTRTATAPAGTCHPWVTIRYYDGLNGTGSSTNMYCDYSNFGSVGFNDRADSMLCYVCPSPIGTNPHQVQMMKTYQQFNQQMLLMNTMTNVRHNISAALRNTASSNQLRFN
ncbi:hypothetical protein ACH4E8_19030 [Streptomyces sp. NPDC017979]|uniref:hypothetical protein n=1 Tax=Streptomyces sp. NPDC017979 TaxID=3365024 RepID=UPI00378E676F